MRDRIPVDLLNPGQVFACLGIAEVAEVLFGAAEGGFVGAGDQVEFVVGVNDETSPLAAAIEFLRSAVVTTEAPQESVLSTAGWGVPTRERGDDVFPFEEPDSLATLPAVLTGLYSGEERRLRIETWGDDRSKGRDNVKFWAGAAGKAGAAFLVDQLNDVRSAPPAMGSELFNYGVPQTGSLRFDWRRDTLALHTGFALNSQQGKVTALGYPFVEALAQIGISHGRPRMFDGKLHYRYGVMVGDRTLWSLPLLRMALGAPETALPIRVFDMFLDWPGQKDQARCIVRAQEVSTPKENDNV